jgi:AcrR family transcriptional regulator
MLGQPSAMHDNETCRRLIAAASEEFAQHGYAGARIRNIVLAAGANLAAINYYFGGKEGLYRATLRHLASEAMARFPQRGERRAQPPETRLHRLVYAFLEGLAPEASSPALGRILAHEAMDPSPHLDRLIEEMTRPQLEMIRTVVREIVGARVPDVQVTLASLSIAGQCLLYLFGRPAVERIYPGVVAGHDSRNRLARQITEFSLAALAALAAAHVPGAPAQRGRKTPAAGSKKSRWGGH